MGVEYLAKKLRLKLYRTCVKDDLNVSEVFSHLGGEFVRNGGQSAFGSTGITSIEDVASKPIVDRNAAAKGNVAAPPEKAVAQPPADQPAFKLGATKQPSVQRTGGKKRHVSCNIL